jgi:hypothetical protein
VPHPPGFPVRLGGVNELHAAFLIESRTRCHGWGCAVGNPGSLNPFFGFKGGIRKCVYRDLWYPTLRKQREGWGTRRFVALYAQEHRAPFAHYSELVRNARDHGNLVWDSTANA